jgi:two-component system, LytTR family, response regulator
MAKLSKRQIERAPERAKKQSFTDQNSDFKRQLEILLQNINQEANYLERIAVKYTEEIIIVRVKEIDWIEPSGNYLYLHAGKKVHVWRGTMGGMEAKLNPRQFLRIQRSVIVNLERIKKIYPLFRGEYEFVLEDGTRLTSARSYRDRLEQVFGRKF